MMKPTYARWERAAAALAGALLLRTSAVLACPSCKDAIAGDPVANALSWTTLLLIAMPALLIGTIGGWVGYVYWRAARHAEPVVRLPIWTEKESET